RASPRRRQAAGTTRLLIQRKQLTVRDMELPTTSRIGRESAPTLACTGYLQRLPLPEQRLCELLDHVNGDASSDTVHVMAGVHRAIAGDAVASDNPAYNSIRRRLELAHDAHGTGAPPSITHDAHKRVRMVSTPALNRTPMAPRLWPPTLLFQLLRSLRTPALEGHDQIPDSERCPESSNPRQRWHRVGAFRRAALGIAIASQTYFATDFMTAVLPYHGSQLLEIAVLVLFAVLFCWISAGFWTAIAGFLVLMFGRDRYAISSTASRDAPIDPHARTAVVMPICNENV